MKFGRLRDGIEQMRGRGDIAVEDVLNLFYDLCEDVREETGRPVDQLEPRNEDALMRRLPWTGNVFVKTYKANKDRFQTQTRVKILQGVESEVSDVVRKTDEAVDVMNQIRIRQNELLEKKRTLQRTLQETEQGRAVCRNIQSEIDTLEREIDPMLKDRIRELREYKKDREKEALILREQVSKDQAALEQIAADNGRLQHERDALREKVEMQTEKYDNLRDEEKKLEDSISSMDAQTHSLEERIRNLQRDLDSRDYENLRKYKMEKIEALEEQRENCTELEEEIDRTRAALEKEQEKFRETTAAAAAVREELERALAEQAQRRTDFEKEQAELERQCEAEKEALRKDQEEFRLRCVREREEAQKREEAFELACSEEKKALEKEAAEFELKCAGKRRAQQEEAAKFQAQCRDELEKIRQEEENFKIQCEARKEVIRRQAQEAADRSAKEKQEVLKLAEVHRQEAEKRRLDILHSREQMEQEQEELLRQEKQMQEELGRMRNKRIEERMDKARARIAIMQEIQGALDSNYEALLLACGKKRSEVPETDVFDACLDKIDSDLTACTVLYRKLVRSLEGGAS